MADTVTQLQDQINNLCQLLCNYAGTLQRDALPVRRALNVVRGARELPRNLARYF
jgi:mediator of RNA polymerase II transcription subunit 21